MDLSLYPKNETAVEAVGGSRRFNVKEAKSIASTGKIKVRLITLKKTEQLRANIIPAFLAIWMPRFARRRLA